VRRLIINADDFGLTAGINRGILESHTRGMVTSATLMAGGERFAEAVSMAKQAPKLSVGCHVVLVDGAPMLSGAEISSLTMSQSGTRFRQSLITFSCLAAAGRLDPAHIEAEVTAQIRKLQAAEILVSHLDSHKHTHMFPAVLRGMLRAAKNCGVRAIRNPFEPLVMVTVRHWKRQFQLRMMRGFKASFRNALADAGVVTTDGCVGVAATGDLNLPTFQRLIENLPKGTWELVSHPGYNDAELDHITTRLRDSREKELTLLTSEAARQILEREQVELISYREL
jgi:hopanoid biosynthesis associated protein HpnK